MICSVPQGKYKNSISNQAMAASNITIPTCVMYDVTAHCIFKTILNVPIQPLVCQMNLLWASVVILALFWMSLYLCVCYYTLLPESSLNEWCKHSGLITVIWTQPMCHVSVCDNSVMRQCLETYIWKKQENVPQTKHTYFHCFFPTYLTTE
jgi:hypothetical protein